MQQLYNLSWEAVVGRPDQGEENNHDNRDIGLLGRIFYGLPQHPPFKPVLGVREGRVDPDGDAVMRKVGGPGFLSVGHDSAAIIARGGTIVKVLGPGWYQLGPFERVWDVVDLRPQRRTLHVETHSRDGIPIYCDAEIVYQLDNGLDRPAEFANAPYQWTEKAAANALKVTTGKVMLKPGGKRRFTTWATRIPNGILDGVIRNEVEKYRLDEYLAPAASGLPLFEQLEAEIAAQVIENAQKAGARVFEIKLAPILPAHDSISQQWIESWRSEWDRVAHELQAEAKALGTQQVKLARVHAQADLVNSIMEAMKNIDVTDPELESAMILTRFMDVIRAFSEDEPLVRSTVFKEAEGLQRILTTMAEVTEITPLTPPEE